MTLQRVQSAAARTPTRLRRRRHGETSIHRSFMWLKAENGKFWVDFCSEKDQEIEPLTRAAADTLAGVDADDHRRDSFASIEKSDPPK